MEQVTVSMLGQPFCTCEMALPDTARADRLLHRVDLKHQESCLIPLASIGLSFKEIRIVDQVSFVIAGQYVFERWLIGYRRVER